MKSAFILYFFISLSFSFYCFPLIVICQRKLKHIFRFTINRAFIKNFIFKSENLRICERQHRKIENHEINDLCVLLESDEGEKSPLLN